MGAEIRIDDLKERLDTLRDAQEMMEGVIEKVRSAISGLEDERWADAYVLAPLIILGCADHTYLTRDPGIHTIIETLEGLIREQKRELEHA